MEMFVGEGFIFSSIFVGFIGSSMFVGGGEIWSCLLVGGSTPFIGGNGLHYL